MINSNVGRIIPPAFGEKKSGELWSTNCGDHDVESYLPKSTFSEDHISAPFRLKRVSALYFDENVNAKLYNFS